MARNAKRTTLLSVTLAVVCAGADADAADDFLNALCLRGFETTQMSAGESQRFCTCVRADVAPLLTGRQRIILTSAESDLAQGRSTKPEVFASSGIRDLVIAAQARCEAAFYPPSAPITVNSGNLALTLRCDGSTKTPEAFVSLRAGGLLSKGELEALGKKMMEGKEASEVAQVNQRIDGSVRKPERWEIDLTGQIVSPPSPEALISALRSARTYEVLIERGRQRHAATFDVAGKIAPRWAPCGGIGK